MEFKASLDTLAKILTLGVILLFIFIGQKSVKQLVIAQSDNTTVLIHSGIILMLLLIIIGCWLFAPKSYSICGGDLLINRPIGNVSFKISEIDEARVLSSNELSGLIRTFGNGGLFGYYGKFYNSKLKHLTLYTTQRKNRILIKTSQSKKIVISPNDLSIVEKLK